MLLKDVQSTLLTTANNYKPLTDPTLGHLYRHYITIDHNCLYIFDDMRNAYDRK